MKRLLAIGGDAGGAAAIAPAIARLLRDGAVSVDSLGYRYAPDVFARHSLPCETLPDTAPTGDADRRLDALRPDFVLTGTTWADHAWEPRFLAAARRRGIPTLSLIDYWANYAVRFALPGGSALPDTIGVIDAQMRDEMLAEGFPAEILSVVGAPQFDALQEKRREFTDERHACLREDAGVASRGLLVLFASQPLAGLFGPDDYLGYTEWSVLDSLVAALDAAAEKASIPVTLLVRPHPREKAERYLPLRGRRIEIRVSADGDAHEWALAADVVAGMSTALLTESVHLGAITLSLQPGLCRQDFLPTNRSGLSIPVYKNDDLAPTVERALLCPTFRLWQREKMAKAPAPEGAARRVCELIYTLLEKESAASPLAAAA